MSYLLSIVVPTYERYKYLRPLIELVKSFNSNNVELVVQDNTYDNSEIVEYIKSISFKHLKYFHQKQRMTVVQNVEKAILNSTGEYLCMIGDDDGVTRNIEDCVKWMKNNNIEALSSRKHPFYKWPDHFKNGGILLYKTPKGTFEFATPQKELKKVCKTGMQNLGLMPKLYGGVVRRDILDKVYETGGTFFPGASADISNAVALCFFVQRHVVVDFPVTISGASLMHGGGIERKKGQMAKLSEVDFISQEVRDNWEPRIPPVWHTCFVWPESGTKALRYMSKEYLTAIVDYDYMLAHFLFKTNLSYLKLCFSYSNSKTKLLLFYIRFWLKRTLVKIKALISLLIITDRRLIYSVKHQKQVKSIVEAEQILFNKTGTINMSDLKERTRPS